MSNSCNQTSTLSNTAEIVENESSYKLSPLRWSRFGCTSFMKKISLVLFSILFISPVFSQSKTVYLSCDTLSLSKNHIEVQTFRKNERIIGLEINRNDEKVVWDKKTMDFIEDYNQDNVYELKTEDQFSRTEIDFNRVTGRLDETIYYIKQNGDIYLIYSFEYQCTKSEPLFER